MNALLIYTHPNPASFCHAVYGAAKQALAEAGCQLRCRDLYADGFDPKLSAADLDSLRAGVVPEDIREEQALIAWADLIVFIYPVWWYGRPALLKGWIDRVLTPGFAYRYEEAGVNGLLAGKRAVVLQTTGAPREAYAANDEEDAIVTPMRDGTLRFCGLEVPAFKTLYAVPYITQRAREELLRGVYATLTAVATNAPS